MVYLANTSVRRTPLPQGSPLTIASSATINCTQRNFTSPSQASSSQSNGGSASGKRTLDQYFKEDTIASSGTDDVTKRSKSS
ncbi:uncharacterized protein L201_006350 [Kwoniella dendrophila CBS 6074]|uniref:Uncharacterized protein n=1 Tax=Kwoniella dendrophila CBS 6074 TaxID=1295534 RepID=A0AAX4K105_9TREE